MPLFWGRNLRATMLDEEAVLLSRLFRRLPPDGMIILKGGSKLHRLASPAFTVLFKDLRAFRKAALSGDAEGLLRAYCSGDIEISGDRYAAFKMKDMVKRDSGFNLRLPVRDAGRVLKQLLFRKSADPDYAGVENESFRKLILGEGGDETIGQFGDESTRIDAAQERLRKKISELAGLKNGLKLIDLGVLDGGALLHEAAGDGCQGVGITFGSRWTDAAQRIDSDAIRIIEREISRSGKARSYDCVISRGIEERLDEAQREKILRDSWQALRDRGLYILVSVNSGNRPIPESQSAFVQRTAFPGVHIEPVEDTIRRAAGAGFEFVSAESIRADAMRTFRAWMENAFTNEAELERIGGRERTRFWQGMLGGLALEFQSGRLAATILVFSKHDAPGLL